MKVSKIINNPTTDFLSTLKSFDTTSDAEKRLWLTRSHLNEPVGIVGMVIRCCGVPKRRVRDARAGIR